MSVYKDSLLLLNLISCDSKDFKEAKRELAKQIICIIVGKLHNTSLAALGVLAHSLQRHKACNAPLPVKSKMTTRRAQNGQWGLERGQTLSYQTLGSIFVKQFFDWIITSMRSSKTQNDHQWAPKWPQGLGRGQPVGFWALPLTFVKQIFVDSSTPYMKERRQSTNVVAS